MKMQSAVRRAAFCLALSWLIIPFPAHAQNQVLGELQLVGKTKAEKTSGVWVDGQYVGYVNELKSDNKILLLPGEHEIAVRQSGYTDFRQQVVVEPRKKIVLQVVMMKDPRTRLPQVTSQIKLQVTPERAAVFVDDAFAGTVGEFSGKGRGMLVSAGKHRIKIALPGYQAFDTEVSLLPQQKITIKTDLLQGSIAQAGDSIKKN
jgi:PEGA domain